MIPLNKPFLIGSELKYIKQAVQLGKISSNRISFDYFNETDRTDTKKSFEDEINLMKFLLPAKAKFVPLK